MSFTFHSVFRTLYRTFHRCFLPKFLHLATRFQRRRLFGNQPIRNKNCLWWPCLLTVRGEMSILYRGPSIDASTQFRFNWPSGFRVEDFLEINQSETRIACGGHVCQRIGTKCAIFIEDLP